MNFNQLRAAVAAETSKVVVGQEAALDQILVALTVRGHALLEGPPGTAKTLLARAIAQALGIGFRRAQFTPDMLPSDLTGTMALTAQSGTELTFRPGPVFTNILLADEINRTPPKTQAALLEAMGEGTVSVDGRTYRLPDPFIVVATQNPIEYEGTYPLPEAQLDRFVLKVHVGYPQPAAEEAMLKLRHAGVAASTIDDVKPVVSAEAIAEVRAEVDATVVADPIVSYVAAIVRATRSVPSIELGASPRAAVHLLAASKAVARAFGRDYVIPDDVAAMAVPVLRHRLMLRADAEVERYGPDDAIRSVLNTVMVPR